jgi:transcription elongation factor Elf1
VIKLKRPVDQYSIYSDKANDVKGESSTTETKKEETKPSKEKPQ